MPVPKVLQTKITPPRRGARTLPRPRVTSLLLEGLNYRLTILQAGAGYGKSTALAALAEEFNPLIWYQVTEEDRDPLLFLLRLYQATARALPDLQALFDWDGGLSSLPPASLLDQYLNTMALHLESVCLLVPRERFTE